LLLIARLALVVTLLVVVVLPFTLRCPWIDCYSVGWQQLLAAVGWLPPVALDYVCTRCWLLLDCFG